MQSQTLWNGGGGGPGRPREEQPSQPTSDHERAEGAQLLLQVLPPGREQNGASALWMCLRSAPTLVVLVFRGVLNASQRKKLVTNVRACNAFPLSASGN